MRDAGREERSFGALRELRCCGQMWAKERQPLTDLILGNAVTCVHYHLSEVMFVFMTI